MGYMMRFLFFTLLSMVWANCALGLETKTPVELGGRTVIEGTLVQVSALPPAAESARGQQDGAGNPDP